MEYESIREYLGYMGRRSIVANNLISVRLQGRGLACAAGVPGGGPLLRSTCNHLNQNFIIFDDFYLLKKKEIWIIKNVNFLILKSKFVQQNRNKHSEVLKSRRITIKTKCEGLHCIISSLIILCYFWRTCTGGIFLRVVILL